MKFACTIASFCVLCLGARAQADITITSSAMLNSAGHLLDGGTFEIEGVIANNTPWTEPIPGGRFAEFSSASMTISGTGTVYDGTFLLSDSPSGYFGSSVDPDFHIVAGNPIAQNLSIWTNGTDELRVGFGFSGSAQDALLGDSVTLTDFTGHIGSTLAIGEVVHVSGSNSFDERKDASFWNNASFSASNVAVPEPSMGGLILLGAAVVGFRRKRKKISR